jgi:hypothetical protein
MKRSGHRICLSQFWLCQPIGVSSWCHRRVSFSPTVVHDLRHHYMLWNTPWWEPLDLHIDLILELLEAVDRSARLPPPRWATALSHGSAVEAQRRCLLGGNKSPLLISMLMALIRTIGYPFASFNQSRRSMIQWTQFYEGLVDPCAALVDLVHSRMHPVYAFSYRKIIHLIQKIPGLRYFYNNTQTFSKL